MRLICPNCGAQYEVDEAVIPDPGRDVQCSNCGHTWFQKPAGKDFETEEELADEAELAEPVTDTPRQELDPDVADILREEAEHEQNARTAEADSIETQPDLGIDEANQDVADRSAAARARMARLRGDDAETDAAVAAAVAGSRKELLPDVEEITSTLRPSEEREAEVEDLSTTIEEPEIIAEKKRGGGRWIFRLLVILALLALAVYVFAPQLAEAVPALQPYLAQYVEFVNDLRAQVDPMIQGLVDQVQGLIGGGEAEPASATPVPTSEPVTPTPEPTAGE